MPDQGLNIVVGADVQQVQAGMDAATASVKEMEKELELLGNAITNSLDRGEDVAKLEDAYDALKAKIKAARAEATQPFTPPPMPPIPAPDDTAFLNTITKQRIAFTDLGRIITGQGFTLRSLASNFALLGPAVTIAAAAIYGLVELLNKQTDAEKKASEEAKKLKEFILDLKDAGDISLGATGSEEGNIARVQALAAAVRDSNLTYAERKNALEQLQETNKAYFGDLTLEAESLKTLSARVAEYSQALIQEAVVKGQVEEIAKVSAELEKQARALDVLRDAKTRAESAVAANPYVDNQSGQLGDVGQNRDAATANNNLVKATNAFKDQQDVVEKLRDQIATYKDELNKAIDLQLQFKPLKDPPIQKDDLKEIVPILEQIQKIYEEIRKPSKEPLFQLQFNSTDQVGLNVIEAQIREAIRKGATDGANDPQVRQAYDDLATALRAKLAHIQNPDLIAHIKYTLADPSKDPGQQVESALEKSLKSALTIKVPANLLLDIEDDGFNAQQARLIEQQLKQDNLSNFYINATANVRLQVGKVELKKAEIQKLVEQFNKQIESGIQSGFENFGSAIGTAIAKGQNPIQAAGKAIVSTIGTLVQDIGKALIEYGTVKEGLDTIFAGGIAIPGVAAIALGVAAEALGGLLKSAGNSYHAFADGGVVTGPTYGLVGEAGPEVIFPLSKINDFARSFQPREGNARVQVEGHISGQNLLLVHARASKNANYVSKAS